MFVWEAQALQCAQVVGVAEFAAPRFEDRPETPRNGATEGVLEVQPQVGNDTVDVEQEDEVRGHRATCVTFSCRSRSPSHRRRFRRRLGPAAVCTDQRVGGLRPPAASVPNGAGPVARACADRTAQGLESGWLRTVVADAAKQRAQAINSRCTVDPAIVLDTVAHPLADWFDVDASKLRCRSSASFLSSPSRGAQ